MRPMDIGQEKRGGEPRAARARADPEPEHIPCRLCSIPKAPNVPKTCTRKPNV
jgi:hypothetical protein